jgi:hypothetical protein
MAGFFLIAGESVGYCGVGLKKPGAKVRDGDFSSQLTNFK